MHPKQNIREDKNILLLLLEEPSKEYKKAIKSMEISSAHHIVVDASLEIKLEKEKKEEESRQVEEIKMLDDIPNDPLASLENCTFDKIISILQNHACHPFVANHVIKEKLNRYHKESMVPPKLGDVWKPRIYVTIGKIAWPAILDLGSSVSAIPKSLSDHLDLPPIEKCDIDLKLLIALSLMHMVESIMFLLSYT
jgi:hypothetical protein